MIETYRENQYKDFQLELIDETPVEYECKACGRWTVEEEINYTTLHDISLEKNLYCSGCINDYQEENL